MPIRYYPASKINPNQNTTGGDYMLNGLPYVGKFYTTYDGQAFSGPDNITGPNERLTPVLSNTTAVAFNNNAIPPAVQSAIVAASPSKKTTNPTATSNANFNGPVPYYPYPIQDDYTRGYIIRYFTKKVNNSGYVIEISPDEYSGIVNGTAPYDVSIYQTAKIMWKLTGPLNSIRISQYDVRSGIIDVNRRLTETTNQTFLGITDFIGGKYDKWAKPTT